MISHCGPLLPQKNWSSKDLQAHIMDNMGCYSHLLVQVPPIPGILQPTNSDFMQEPGRVTQCGTTTQLHQNTFPDDLSDFSLVVVFCGSLLFGFKIAIMVM
jgi:hypothetical protein